MNTMDCDRLDDFLDHDLRGEDRRKFVEHTETCAACREAVGVQDSLVERLQKAIDRGDAEPRDLVRRIDRRIRWARFHRFAITGLAASVAFAALWLAIDRPPRRLDVPSLVVAVDRPKEESPVRIRFPNRDVIAMPVESDSPRVTVVMVYPELQAAAPVILERNER